jgi:hypothetical protein
MEAQTKSGRIIIENGSILLRREGIPGFLAAVSSVLLFPVRILTNASTDSSIPISKIEKVEYSQGVNFVTRPHMKVYYGKPKPRFVIFKRALVDLDNYQGAVAEMEKAVAELKRLGVKTVKI